MVVAVVRGMVGYLKLAGLVTVLNPASRRNAVYYLECSSWLSLENDANLNHASPCDVFFATYYDCFPIYCVRNIKIFLNIAVILSLSLCQFMALTRAFELH